MVEKRAVRAILLFGLAVVVVVGLLSWIYLQKPQQSVFVVPGLVVPEGGILFFYGDTCPHCKLVENFIAENNITSKLNITFKEIYSNSENAAEIVGWAKECGVKDSVGVPFIVTDGACYMGDKASMNFLKEKTGLQ